MRASELLLKVADCKNVTEKTKVLMDLMLYSINHNLDLAEFNTLVKHRYGKGVCTDSVELLSNDLETIDSIRNPKVLNLWIMLRPLVQMLGASSDGWYIHQFSNAEIEVAIQTPYSNAKNYSHHLIYALDSLNCILNGVVILHKRRGDVVEFCAIEAKDDGDIIKNLQGSGYQSATLLDKYLSE